MSSQISKKQKEELRSMISTYNSDDSSDSDSNSNDNKKIKFPTEFKEHVTKYIEVDDIMELKNKELKTLRTAKKQHEQYILKFLTESGKKTIPLSNGKLSLTNKETKSAINEDLIKNVLVELGINGDDINRITTVIDSKREIKSNINLKRKKNASDK